jgi:predicted GNAT family N-acyltransferase
MQRQYVQIDHDDLLPNLYHLCTMQQPKNYLTILRVYNDDNYDMIMCKIGYWKSVLVVSHENCATLDGWYL